MSLIDNIKKATEYKQTMVNNLNAYVEEAYRLLNDEDPQNAQNVLIDGYNYYHPLQEDELPRFKFILSNDDMTDNISDEGFQAALIEYNTVNVKFTDIVQKLNAAKALNETAAEAAKALNEANKASDSAKEANKQAIKAYKALMGLGDEAAQEHINMQILGGFIAALGTVAVAIAFVGLNAAGLAMPGVVLAGFGIGTTLLGCSIFSSTAKNMDDYTSKLYESFVIPAA